LAINPKDSYVQPQAVRRIPDMTEFVQWLTGTHERGCGAKYKVTVTEVPADSVTCEKCGTLMDSRNNRSCFAYARMPGDE
jgi:hypothetical protein